MHLGREGDRLAVVPGRGADHAGSSLILAEVAEQRESAADLEGTDRVRKLQL